MVSTTYTYRAIDTYANTGDSFEVATYSQEYRSVGAFSYNVSTLYQKNKDLTFNPPFGKGFLQVQLWGGGGAGGIGNINDRVGGGGGGAGYYGQVLYRYSNNGSTSFGAAASSIICFTGGGGQAVADVGTAGYSCGGFPSYVYLWGQGKFVFGNGGGQGGPILNDGDAQGKIIGWPYSSSFRSPIGDFTPGGRGDAGGGVQNNSGQGGGGGTGGILDVNTGVIVNYDPPGSKGSAADGSRSGKYLNTFDAVYGGSGGNAGWGGGAGGHAPAGSTSPAAGGSPGDAGTYGGGGCGAATFFGSGYSGTPTFGKSGGDGGIRFTFWTVT